jgi:hypothetical protein
MECSLYIPHFLSESLNQAYDANFLQANHTFQAAEARTIPPQCSFILTRAFYVSSQRFDAMWTGDNHGMWEHGKDQGDACKWSWGDTFRWV